MESQSSIYLHFPDDVVEDTTTFSSVYFWLLYQKSGIHECVDLFLTLYLYFIDQHVCFCANTMLVLLL